MSGKIPFNANILIQRFMRTKEGENMNHIEQLILYKLADACAEKRTAWISQPTIARKCNLKERCIRDHLYFLEADAYILPKHRPGRSTIYSLNVPDVDNLFEGYKFYTVEELSKILQPRHNMPDTPAQETGVPRHNMPPTKITTFTKTRNKYKRGKTSLESNVVNIATYQKKDKE